MADRGRRDLEQLVDDLADRLRRSVVVDDATIRLVYSSRHFGDEDQQRIRAVLQHDVGGSATAHILGSGVETWPAPGPIPARDDLGMARRWCAPLRWHGHFLGVLMVIDADASLTAGQLADIHACSTDVAALLFREDADDGRRRLDTAVADALSTESSRRATGLAALRDDDAFRDTGECRVSLVRVLGQVDPVRGETVLRSVLDILTRTRAATVAYAANGAEAAILHTGAAASDEAALDLADAVVERTSTTLGGHRVVCGAGSVRSTVADAWTSLRDAQRTADCLQRMPTLGDVRRHDDLGPYAVLMQLPESALDADALPGPLRSLLDADPSRTLTTTLLTYLDHAGNSPRTAEALHIHRTSLYYRLGRIREITGADLDDGRTRLTLHIGLALLPMLTPPP